MIREPVRYPIREYKGSEGIYLFEVMEIDDSENTVRVTPGSLFVFRTRVDERGDHYTEVARSDYGGVFPYSELTIPNPLRLITYGEQIGV